MPDSEPAALPLGPPRGQSPATLAPHPAVPQNAAPQAVLIRRWLYLLVITVAGAQGLANILTATVLYSPVRWPENRPPHSLLFSANDRSRWCTVWSLAERGTYQIDEIIRQPGWDTIDKVYYRDHFYSSKPPLLATLVAGLYRVLKSVSGLDLLNQTHETVQLILVLINWLPWLAALALLALLAERYAQTDWSRLLLVTAAASGTFLTTFLVTFNNHTIAACGVVFALVPALGIVIDQRRERRLFALAGFFSAWVVCNELPACAFGVALFFVLLRQAPRETLTFFVPAALVPLAGFFYTNWLCTGGVMPFYASFGADENNYYRYVVEGIPSYWMNPSAVDRGESSPLVYLFNCTIGHHGIFSLSPIFLVTAAGWLWIARRAAAPLRAVTILGLALTVWVLAFYLLQTKSYNYGGVTSGLRWSFWLIPFWLLALVPVIDDCGSRRSVRIACAALLGLSVFSATYPHHNPWQQPWLYHLFERQGWLSAPPPAEPLPSRTQSTWFDLPPVALPDPGQYWVEFEGPGDGGIARRMRLALEGAPDDDRCAVEVTIYEGESARNSSLSIDRKAFDAHEPVEKLLLSPGPDEPAGRRHALRFLAGLPGKVTYSAGVRRYLKTPLRRDAFECRVAGVSLVRRAQNDGPALRYRRIVWWSPEVPFGVVQVEDTITDTRDNSVVYRQRMTAARMGRWRPPTEPVAGGNR